MDIVVPLLADVSLTATQNKQVITASARGVE